MKTRFEVSCTVYEDGEIAKGTASVLEEIGMVHGRETALKEAALSAELKAKSSMAKILERMPKVPCKMKHRRASAGGFSLIELLFVMAMIVVLLSITAGPLSPLRANQVTTTGNEFVEAIKFARQNSITKMALTAVVVKDSKFCLFESTPTDAGNFIGRQLTAWKTIPPTVKVEPWEVLDSSGAWTVAPQKVPVSMPADMIAGAMVQTFAPSGEMVSFAQMRVSLSDALNPANTYTILVIRDTGIPVVMR